MRELPVRVGIAVLSLLGFALLLAIRQASTGTFARVAIAALAFALGAVGLMLLLKRH